MAIRGQTRAQALVWRLPLRQSVNIAARSAQRPPTGPASKVRLCCRPPPREVIRSIVSRAPQDIALQRPSIQIANPAYAPDSFRTVCLWAQLLTKVAYVKIDAPIKRRKFPAQDLLR